ncbi:MAG: energy transducer TonB [Chitinophagales bacterium]
MNTYTLLGITIGSVVLFYLISRFLTLFVMNGGKNEEQIIDLNKDKNDANRFAVKYPEASLKTARYSVMALGFIFAFGSAIGAFNYAKDKGEIAEFEMAAIDDDFEIEAPQTEQVKPPPPPPPPPPEIEVVDDEEILEEEPEIQDTEIEEDEIVEVPEVVEEEEVVEQEVFTVVEDMPKFKGCESLKGDAASQCTMKKIQEYTAKVDYPQIAVDNDIEGKVFISFVVDKDGSVKEVTLLRGVDKLLDNAAMKHIKNLPKFASPGKQRGKAVKVKYNIPIVFRLG